MTMSNRAYSLLEVKRFDDKERTFEGLASTPSIDRVGDVVNPLGAEFSLPMPLLLDHDSTKQVGHVEFAKPNKNGIPFKARIAQIDEPGSIKDMVDGAWQLVKARLRSFVSIGFKAIDFEIMPDGGINFKKWAWLELSLVSVPAQAEAVIFDGKSIQEQFLAFKSLDTAQRAATGQTLNGDEPAPPGASGKPKTPKAQEGKMTTKTNLAEQITALEAKRAASVARMEAIMQKTADDGETADAAAQEELDGIETLIETVDKDLARFRKLEKFKALSAKPVIEVKDEQSGIDVRGPGSVVVKAEPKLGPGIGFARVVKCIALGGKMYRDPAEIAKELYGENSVVVGHFKASVLAGSTVSGNWAANLVGAETGLVADFVEYLRPKTIIGMFGTNGIPSLRNVPFYTPLVTQTSAGAGYWVGEGKAKPLTSFGFSRTTLTPLKVANICVLTEESIKHSSPKSDTLVRDELVNALVERLDTDFIDPNKTASAGVSPASITNGAPSIASTGVDGDAVRLDIRSLFDVFDTADNPAEDAVLIMSSRNARGASGLRNDLGQSEFGTMTPRGGTIDGVPVIVSRRADNRIILVNASDIYLGDEGGVSVDMSREASLEMSDAPSHNSTTPTAAQLVSMFQTNSVAIRAERTINWARRRTNSVVYLTSAQWGGDLATV